VNLPNYVLVCPRRAFWPIALAQKPPFWWFLRLFVLRRRLHLKRPDTIEVEHLFE
jgi:hypothetical protein